MLIAPENKAQLAGFVARFGLRQPAAPRQQDKMKKTEQVLGYLEEIHTRINRYSRKRPLLLVEPAAGNCYVSFAVCHYYTQIDPRPVEIHCIDWNAELMEKNAAIAAELGFHQMHFHAGDIADIAIPGRPDLVYALHACDTASDKVLFMGARTGARNILNVSCCQHGFTGRLRPAEGLRALTRHQITRDRFAQMAADALRAKLMEMAGYRTAIVEFVSLKATGKNLMLRAERQPGGADPSRVADYLALRQLCSTAPVLETYLQEEGLIAPITPVRKAPVGPVPEVACACGCEAANDRDAPPRAGRAHG